MSLRRLSHLYHITPPSMHDDIMILSVVLIFIMSYHQDMSHSYIATLALCMYVATFTAYRQNIVTRHASIMPE